MRPLMILCLMFCGVANAAPADADLAALGQLLFFDANLSRERSQSCGTCHDPQWAFTDRRGNVSGNAVSVGGDGHSLGDRHTPTLSYIGLTPPLRRAADGQFIGGFFHDGRAPTLAEQAMEPIINPIEMALHDADMVAARIQENRHYTAELTRLFGPSVLSEPQAMHRAVGRAIAAFERSSAFNAFDSKYDRHLRGQYQLTAAEETGRILFFADLLNCNGCHHLNQDTAQEPFTDYTYHNIGVPINQQVRALNGSAPDHIDPGLAANPRASDPQHRGKFKVPTLRNVAVTAPYMHNGVFNDLETVLRFYNQYLINGTINPETGQPWQRA